MSGLKNVKYKLIASVCAALLATNMTPVYAAPQDAAPAAETMSEADTPSPVKDDADVSADPVAAAAQSAVTATVTSNGQTYNLALDGTLGNESSDEILGESWYYGVVADTFTFNGESETNFAVKSFEHANGGEGQTGVTDKGAGSKVDWITAGHVDAPFMVKGISAKITAPEDENNLFKNSTGGGTLTFHNLSADKINEYVTDLRNDASEQAQRLGGMSSAKAYSDLPQNQMTIDITPAGASTVYLNVDAWDGLKNMLQQSSGVTIVKNPGQKIVFAYPQSENVTTQKIVIRQDGQNYDTTGLANVSTQTTRIAPDIIYAMPAARSVTLNDTTGIIFAPNATVNCYGVDAGWINCQHFINDCEWHFINGSLPEKMTLGAKRPHPKKYENTEKSVMPAKSNKTVEQSESPKKSETSEQPSKAPEKSKATAQPKISTAPKATVTPTEMAQPKISTAPKATVTPTETTQPKESTTPKATVTSTETAQPKESTAPKAAVTPTETIQPKTTTTPEAPETTGTPEIPEATESPEKTEKSTETDTPKKPEVPTETDTPKKPEISTETIVPTNPEQTTNLKESETTEELTKADKPTETDTSKASTQSTQSTASAPSQVQGPAQMLTSAQPQAATVDTSHFTGSAATPQTETTVVTDTVKISDSPQTGDSSHLRIYTSFMVGSLAALFGVAAFWRKRKHS